MILGLAAGSALAQYKGVTYVGKKGVVDTVAAMNARSAKESDLLKWIRIPKKTEKEGPDRRNLPLNPGSQEVPSFPATSPQGVGGDGSQGGRGGIYSPQTIDFQFNGPTLNESGFVPPDVQGDVSPTQILIAVNGRIRSYDRNGVAGSLNVTPESFFNSVRNGSGISDPRVRWDRLSNRWIVIAINVSSPNRLVVAVSNGATITNTSSFTFYFLTTPSAFADYPSLGVDANALYVGENTFNTSLSAFLGTNVWVIRKTSVLSGGPIVGTRFNTSGASGAGLFTPQGVDNDDPAATQGYFIGVDNAAFGLLQMRRVSNPGGSPTISGNLPIGVPSTAFPLDAQHPGSATRLDALDDRLYNAAIRRDRITGNRTLVTSHNIRINSSGVGSSGGDRTGSRWYEIGNLTGTPSLVQSGTAFDNAATGFLYTWMPSINKSGQGHFAIGVNRANTSTRVQIATAGRLRTDALGTTQAATVGITSGFNYAIGGNPFRWGDYSMVVVDPTDDQTMWCFHEFVSSNNVWAVRVLRLRAPAPAAIASLSPNTLGQGASGVNVVVTGTSSSGTEFYDTDPAFPNRLLAAFSGSDVTVNSVTWDSPTQATLNVSVGGSAATGGRTLTMTNPDQQTSQLANALTITGSAPEVVVPSSFTTVLGRLDAGDVASLSADDDNYLRHCKFIV
ncbi:MAG: hypothetical protein IT207_12005, partial [Fimbriimonadaceae bacterium]|nr:hypothetical protein [Fimbriimonadaceae bacterium]